MVDANQVLATVGQRYADAGFTVAEMECTNGIAFENAFSVQAVFIVDSHSALESEWSKRHEELVDAYRNYNGFVDMEWNFYCIFVILESGDLDALQRLRRTIESDTSYSRKFVLLAEEVQFLPPGRIDTPVGTNESAQGDPLGEWRSVLGEDLFDQVSGTTFARLKDVLGEIVRKEAAHDD